MFTARLQARRAGGSRSETLSSPKQRVSAKQLQRAAEAEISQGIRSASAHFSG